MAIDAEEGAALIRQLFKNQILEHLQDYGFGMALVIVLRYGEATYLRAGSQGRMAVVDGVWWRVGINLAGLFYLLQESDEPVLYLIDEDDVLSRNSAVEYPDEGSEMQFDPRGQSSVKDLGELARLIGVAYASQLGG